ncbi:MAG TPA: hypothetical protein VKA46_18490 [Gemmataceae bacterium]|nr:hypothetical protein [Gemmataceae bacterium]
MPRPVYLLCSQSGAIDETSNAISFFNLIEEVKRFKIPKKHLASAFRPLAMRVVACWMNADGDAPGQVFEAQFAAKYPNKGEELPDEYIFSTPAFSFKTVYHRLIAPVVELPPFAGPGILWIECRVRRQGEQDWLAKQEYPIQLIDVTPSGPGGGENIKDGSADQ